MKSQFSLKRIGSCIWFVVVVAIALSFSGCETVSGRSIPVTDEIITTIQRMMQEGQEEVHYYVSKTINVRFTQKSTTSSVVNHEIHWDITDINRTVRITPQIPGVVQGNLSLTSVDILFKTDQGETVITFTKSTTGSAERYIYNSVKEWRMSPNNSERVTDNFDVSFRNPNEQPSLLVISQENIR